MSYVKRLVDQSSLTQAQLESLLLYSRVLSGDLTLNEAAKLRTNGPVSVGAYQRVVKQGLNNLQQAMITILLGTKMRLLKGEELKKLVELVDKSPNELPEEQEEVFVTLLYALVKKIVM